MLEAKNICLEVDPPPGSSLDVLRLLDVVNFEVPNGHLMAIVGPSGCGKTTLLKVVAGMEKR